MPSERDLSDVLIDYGDGAIKGQGKRPIGLLGCSGYTYIHTYSKSFETRAGIHKASWNPTLNG